MPRLNLRAVRSVPPAVWAGAVFVFLLVLLFVNAMTPKLNHDEQQFVAAGQLLAAHGMLPYRDFPFFHMPMMVLINGGIFTWTDHLLFAARTSAVLWTGLTLAAIWGMGVSLLKEETPHRRWLIALIPVAILFCNPIFAYSYFRSWNQALPTLSIIAAIMMQCRGAQTGRYRFFIVSGILVALAAGTRLSFAPLGLPFWLMAWFLPGADRGRRLRSAGAFFVGLVVGFLPSAVVIAHAPMEFLFDNFAYNGPINSAFRGDDADFAPASVDKAWVMLKLLLHPGTMAFVATFIFLNWPSATGRKTYFRRLVLAVLVFAWLGALVASPSYIQYYFPVVAVLAVGILAGLIEVRDNPRRYRWGCRLAMVSIAIGLVGAASEYWDVIQIFRTKKWATIQIHNQGVELRKSSPQGTVLTFAPIVALEGGMDIYPCFAPGIFAWRTAEFLTPEQRKRYGFVGQAELEEMLAKRPPVSIMTGWEDKYDGPLLDYAKRHNFREIKLPKERSLWVAPPR